MIKLKFLSLSLGIILFSACSLTAQTEDSTHLHQHKARPKRPAIRNVVWFEPTKAKEINGLALGSFSSDLFYHNDSLHVNGLEIYAEPLSIYVFPYFVIAEIKSLFRNTKKDSIDNFIIQVPDSAFGALTNSVVNGLHIGILGSFEKNHYNGINIGSILPLGRNLNGLSITAGENIFYNYHGLLIAGLMNKVAKGKGIQIALVNRCRDCRGIQIGLLNTMGKRTFPFLNARF